MTALSSFIQSPKKIYYEGEDNDEQILYVLRRSHWTNVGWILMLLIMAAVPIVLLPYLVTVLKPVAEQLGAGFMLAVFAFWYLAVFGLWLFQFLNWFFNVYIISNKKIVDFDFYGLTYKNISDTAIGNVQDVTAKINGPLRMIFNIGDVYIQTAAEHREFDFSSVDDPGKVRDIISDMTAKVSKT